MFPSNGVKYYRSPLFIFDHKIFDDTISNILFVIALLYPRKL